MRLAMNSISYTTLFILCFTFTPIHSKTAVSPPSPPLPPTPAPAPTPDYVNLTSLLSVAGPFSTFLKLLQSTKVIETFQTQANNTEEGITIFVPKDSAFSSLKNPSLKNLTNDQLKSLCLFHALPHFYKLADFTNLSQHSPIPTFAGSNQFGLNVTDNFGTIRIHTGWTETKITSAVHSTDPVAIYETDKVLLPVAIFGTDIPPAPAPVPAPEVAPAADSPAADKGGKGSSDSTSKPSSSTRVLSLGGLNCVLAAIVGVVVFC